jgi:hypothetical protein
MEAKVASSPTAELAPLPPVRVVSEFVIPSRGFRGDVGARAGVSVCDSYALAAGSATHAGSPTWSVEWTNGFFVEAWALEGVAARTARVAGAGTLVAPEPDEGEPTPPRAPCGSARDGREGFARDDGKGFVGTTGLDASSTTGSTSAASRAAFVTSSVVREPTAAVRFATLVAVAGSTIVAAAALVVCAAAEATFATTGSADRVTSFTTGATEAVVVPAADFAVEVVVETVPVTAATVDATGTGAGAGCEAGSEAGAVGVVAAATDADGTG